MCTFSVLTMACMQLQFLTPFQKRQLKMPSSIHHVMPDQLEQRTATKLFHLFLFWKKGDSPGPNLQEQTRLMPEDSQRTEHPRTREKTGVRKRRKIWFLSKVAPNICLFFLWLLELRLQNSTPIQTTCHGFISQGKFTFKFKLDSIKIGATFGLLILLPLFLEQSHFWNEKRRHRFNRKHVTIKCWLEKDCLVLMETETIIEACSIINCNYAAA